MQENSKEKLKIKGGGKNTAGLKREIAAEARENIKPVQKERETAPQLGNAGNT